MIAQHSTPPREFFYSEFSDIAVFQMDVHRCITTWSPEIESILGYGENDFVGLDARELFTPEDRECQLDEAEFERARREGRSPDTRWHIKKDGRRIFVDGVLRSIAGEDGRHSGYVKVIRDISPHRMGDGMLRAILDRTPDLIYLTDGAGRFTFVNSAAARSFGRGSNEIVGSSLEDIFPAHISGPLRKDDLCIIEKREPRIAEERLLLQDGEEHTFLTGKAPWYDGRGNVIGVTSIAQDISDRKKAEGEREDLVQQLRRSNENFAEFSHVVAHDLQAPLRAMSSYTELLFREYGDHLDSTADEFISLIRQGASSMDELIRSLLRYAEAGEERMASKTVGLDAVLDVVRSNLQAAIRETSAQLNYASLPTITGDPVQLLQLFQNLVGNGIKYARAGVQPQIKITALPIGSDGYRFAVEDNGLGIDEKYFEQVFAPLKRLHGPEIPGSGIGLAICKKIVERRGGRIWLESQVGVGSTFYFTI